MKTTSLSSLTNAKFSTAANSFLFACLIQLKRIIKRFKWFLHTFLNNSLKKPPITRKPKKSGKIFDKQYEKCFTIFLLSTASNGLVTAFLEFFTGNFGYLRVFNISHFACQATTDKIYPPFLVMQRSGGKLCFPNGF